MSEAAQMLQAAKIFAAAVASQARVAGMVAENQHRVQCGESVAYGADEFNYEASSLEASTHHTIQYG